MTKFKINLISILILVFSCSEKKNTETKIEKEKNEFRTIISEYLELKKLEPTIVFNNASNPNKKFAAKLLDNEISWSEKNNAIEIIINEVKLNTADKVSLNNTTNNRTDSINFANNIKQIKLYESDSLIGFLLTYEPCTGLGCNVNYQIIYDLKTKSESYFGKFKSEFEFELYDFNQDSKIDYLSNTFYDKNEKMVNTIEYIMYSQAEKGNFEEFKSKDHKKYSFKYSYPQIYENNDSTKEKFTENWIEPINQVE